MKVNVEIVAIEPDDPGYLVVLRAEWMKPPQRAYTFGTRTVLGRQEPFATDQITDETYEVLVGSDGTYYPILSPYESPSVLNMYMDIEDDDIPPRKLRTMIRKFVATELSAVGWTCTPKQVVVKRLDDPDEEIVAKTVRLHDGDPLGPPRLPTTVGTNIYVKRMAESVPVGSTDAETLEAVFSFARFPSNLTVLQWRLCAFADDGTVRRSDLGLSAQPIWQGAVGTSAGSRLTASFDLSLPAQEPLAAAGRVLLVPAIRRMTTGSVNLRAAGLISRAVVKLES